MQRRLFGLAAAGVAAALAFSASGCGSGSGSSGTVTLNMVAADYGSTPDTTSKKYWDNLAADFTRKYPKIKVNVQVFSWSTIDQQVTQMIKQGDVPDILQTDSYADFASRGMLYSADDLLPVQVQSDFIPDLSDSGRYNRTQYGIPFSASTRLFFYNTKLFAKAGITTGAPKTWEQLRQDAVALKNAGVEMPFGLPLGPEEAQGEALLWMLGNDGDYTDEAGSYTIDSSANVSTFKWLKDNLVAPGLTGSSPSATNRQDVFDEFDEGKVGMLNGHPSLVGSAQQAGIKFKVAPVPGKKGPLSETLGVSDWMMGFKKNGHRDQIGKFLTYFYQQDNSVAFLNEYNLLPVTTTASDEMRKDPSLKSIWPFLDVLDTSRSYPTGDPAWGPISSELRTRIGKAASDDPKGVLQELQNYAQKQVSTVDNQAAPSTGPDH